MTHDPEAVERLATLLERSDEYEPLGHDGWEAAALIRAQAAEIGRLTEQRDICPDCMGSGYWGHPDNSDTCRRCGGSGGIAPQPDADEREAMVAVIRERSGLSAMEAGMLAADLLAAGWTRKRKEG